MLTRLLTICTVILCLHSALSAFQAQQMEFVVMPLLLLCMLPFKGPAIRWMMKRNRFLTFFLPLPVVAMIGGVHLFFTGRVDQALWLTAPATIIFLIAFLLSQRLIPKR